MAPKTPTKKSAAQVSFARKAAKLKADRRKPALPAKLSAANRAHIIEAGLAADGGQPQSDREHAHGARAPPPPIGVRLLSKKEVCAIANATFPSVWAWMRAGTFPRSRIVNGRSMWLSSEIEAWIAGLPLRPLKGDHHQSDQKIEEPEPA
jgi:predicted DNA-binding transcriptional regulator AlpA